MKRSWLLVILFCFAVGTYLVKCPDELCGVERNRYGLSTSGGTARDGEAHFGEPAERVRLRRTPMGSMSLAVCFREHIYWWQKARALRWRGDRCNLELGQQVTLDVPLS